MRYPSVQPARFLARPNRFVARVEDEAGRTLSAHIKNTSRCAELFVPGARVWLTFSDAPGRKTPCDLIALEKQTARGPVCFNVDSAAPNAAAGEWLAAGGLGALTALRPEYRLGDSRFDWYAEQAGRPVLVEVKGCTLENDGFARFPDAPTERGLKHVRELTALAGKGYRCCVLIVLQFKGARAFGPNWAAQPAFGEALAAAAAAGVEVRAMDCIVTPGAMALDVPVPIRWERPDENENRA